MKRIATILLALLLGGGGLAMLFSGVWWAGEIPGLIAFNPEDSFLARLLGCAYIVCSIILVRRVARPHAGIEPAAAVAGFLGLLALIHGYDLLSSKPPLASGLSSYPLFILPALVAIWLTWPDDTIT